LQGFGGTVTAATALGGRHIVQEHDWVKEVYWWYVRIMTNEGNCFGRPSHSATRTWHETNCGKAFENYYSAHYVVELQKKELSGYVPE